MELYTKEEFIKAFKQKTYTPQTELNHFERNSKNIPFIIDYVYYKGNICLATFNKEATKRRLSRSYYFNVFTKNEKGEELILIRRLDEILPCKKSNFIQHAKYFN